MADETERRRLAAALPPMMLSARRRNTTYYIDMNGYVNEPLKAHNEHVDYFLGTWSEDERQACF